MILQDSGRGLFRMAGDFGKGISTFIWSIIVLSDSTVVSGDNRGHVQVWDGETGVLIVTIRQHSSEILALASSPDESQIFASGVDNRVICIQRVMARGQAEMLPRGSGYVSPADSMWVYSSSHRPHTHDVFSLAVCVLPDAPVGDAHSPLRHGPVLLSGGLDCKLCVYSISDFAKTRPTFILPVPANSLMQSSATGDVLAVRHRNHVDVWSVSLRESQIAVEKKRLAAEEDKKSSKKPKGRKPARGKGTEEVEVPVASVEIAPAVIKDDGCVLKLRIEVVGADHIHTIALSPDGRFLALSRHSGTRLWILQPSIVAIELPAILKSQFCHSITFSADSHRLALGSSCGEVWILDATLASPVSREPSTDNDDEDDSDNEKIPAGNIWTAQVRFVLNHASNVKDYVSSSSSAKMEAGGLESAISGLVFSPDGCYLALSDSHRCVYVYELDR